MTENSLRCIPCQLSCYQQSTSLGNAEGAGVPTGIRSYVVIWKQALKCTEAPPLKRQVVCFPDESRGLVTVSAERV